jgi:hypothetical protein
LFYKGWDSAVSVPNTIFGKPVTELAGSSFINSNLMSVTIPDSVTSIDAVSFLQCINLNAINVASGNLNYSSDNGILFNKDKTTIFEYPLGKTATTYVIPDGVTRIDSCAFFGSKLTEVNIPEGLTTIYFDAFHFGSNLTKVNIPSSTTFIATGAFYGCNNLNIYGKSGSMAEEYALAEGIQFVATDETPSQTPTPTPFVSEPPSPTSTPPSPTPTPTPTPSPTPFCNTTTPPTPVPTFPGIEDHWAHSYINDLAAKGIICGYELPSGTFEFRPDNPIKREELAKIIAVAYEIYNPLAASTFADCTADKWFSSFVGSLEGAGITNGAGYGIFSAGANITRQDAVTMITRAMAKYQTVSLPDETETETILSKFVDASEFADYAKVNVAFMVDAGIINGYEKGSGSGTFEFRPRNNVTRAEICKIMILSLDISPIPTPIPTPTPSGWTPPPPTPTPSPTLAPVEFY